MIKKIKTNAIILCGLLLTVSCRENLPDFERTDFKLNDQQFEILTTFKLFDNYLIECDKFNNNFNTASEQLLYNPIRNEIIEKAEAPFLFKTIELPYDPNDLLKKEIELLKSGGLIDIAKSALVKITESLSGANTKIIFLPANPSLHDYYKKLGVCMNGITIGSGKIIIQIDPTFDNWKETLPYVIAHEYHHSTWISRNWVSSDFSLLEYLIFEGRADMFAKGLYNDIETPWTKMINEEQEHFVWNEIQPEIHEKGHDRINKVMFGSGDIPFGSGYTIGYNIVKSFKQNNPTFSDMQIMDMNPEKILEMSGYR